MPIMFDFAAAVLLEPAWSLPSDSSSLASTPHLSCLLQLRSPGSLVGS